MQLACNDPVDGTDLFPGQDAEQGRDAEAPDPDDGLGGFSFTKLDNVGTPLADQQSDYATNPWSCVSDSVTGLVWEVKTDDEGLQDRDWTYSWYNSGGSCVDELSCDTEQYVAAVNAAGLCGFSNWRLPTPVELMSLLVFNPVPFAELTFPLPPSIDLNFFPNTLRADYWTSVSTATVSSVHVVFFGGNTDSNAKAGSHSVRLVRSDAGQQR